MSGISRREDRVVRQGMRPQGSALLQALDDFIEHGPQSADDLDKEWREAVERNAANPPIEVIEFFRNELSESMYSTGTDIGYFLQQEAELYRNAGCHEKVQEVEHQRAQLASSLRQTFEYLNSPEFENVVREKWAQWVRERAEIGRKESEAAWNQMSARLRQRMAGFEDLRRRLQENDELRARFQDLDAVAEAAAERVLSRQAKPTEPERDGTSTSPAEMKTPDEVEQPVYLFRYRGAVYEVRFEGESGTIDAGLDGAGYIFELLQHPNKHYKPTDLAPAIESHDADPRQVESQVAGYMQSLRMN